MTTPNFWVVDLFTLFRPEYAKQTEALLTDLIWRSKGSTLYRMPSAQESSYLEGLAGLERNDPKLPSMQRLIPRHAGKGTSRVVETVPIAEQAQVSNLFLSQEGIPTPTRALLTSILAPQSRSMSSFSCVPIHPDVVVLQTLHGLVNKDRPPNLAEIIETIGWFGGSTYDGQVAQLLLRVFSQKSGAKEGLAGLVDELMPLLAQHTWSAFPDVSGMSSQSLPSWPTPCVGPRETAQKDQTAISSHIWTPFSWFWEKWSTLCLPANGWYDALPTRRFVDWAMCLLRTGLVFSYLWEADFYTKLHASIVERVYFSGQTIAAASLQSMLEISTVLATIESPRLPSAQKHAWTAISALLAKGYEARRSFEHYITDNFSVPEGSTFYTSVEAWLDSIPTEDLRQLATTLPADSREIAKNTKYFVKYLLLPRSSDDAAADQADLYYLARSNTSDKFWFQPGPEWLVVVTGLLGTQPGGQCTLGALIRDLKRLGIRVERSVLVGMLEEAGLTTDSPDADDAIIIHSGF
ncbi:hypothetical protein [Candidatus Chloroploca sp. Khr17]|uniref:hypothetical protein n=1 Tax=Candidatus Chloroploca sp. Khr17 TaxID=2496869 RepID=UPI00101C45E1|nr:hypothetical protein [Candidatus Chloroploca sp. Khr17]